MFTIMNRHDAFRHALSLSESNVIVLKLWQIPSFTPPKGWIVFFKHPQFARRRNDEQSIPYVRKVEFSSKYQNQQYSLTQLKVNDAPIGRLECLQHLEQAGQISVPIVIEDFRHGSDGTSYGLEVVQGGFGGSMIYWWEDGPLPWKPITTWFNSFIRLLQEAVSEKHE
jgi:hypothetical protein